MPKKMAISSVDKESPIESHINLEQNFFFAEPGNPKLCYVYPYVIVTDGKDFLFKEGVDRSIDIGWMFEINKKKGDFDSVVEECILNKFWMLWKNVSTTDKDVDKIAVSVHKTGKGIYSLNKNKYFPIYFIIIPNNTAVRLYPKDHIKDVKNVGTLDIQIIMKVSSNPSMSYISQKIIQMLRCGEIILPIISEPKYD